MFILQVTSNSYSCNTPSMLVILLLFWLAHINIYLEFHMNCISMYTYDLLTCTDIGLLIISSVHHIESLSSLFTKQHTTYWSCCITMTISPRGRLNTLQYNSRPNRTVTITKKTSISKTVVYKMYRLKQDIYYYGVTCSITL